jgi:hypothetical protein
MTTARLRVCPATGRRSRLPVSCALKPRQGRSVAIAVALPRGRHEVPQAVVAAAPETPGSALGSLTGITGASHAVVVEPRITPATKPDPDQRVPHPTHRGEGGWRIAPAPNGRGASASRHAPPQQGQRQRWFCGILLFLLVINSAAVLMTQPTTSKLVRNPIQPLLPAGGDRRGKGHRDERRHDRGDVHNSRALPKEGASPTESSRPSAR